VGVPHPPLFFAPSPNAVPPDRSDVRPLPIDDRRSHECAVPCGPQALHFSSSDLRITSFDILTFRATAEQVRPTTRRPPRAMPIQLKRSPIRPSLGAAARASVAGLAGIVGPPAEEDRALAAASSSGLGGFDSFRFLRHSL